jgi:hypothetical protein
VEPQYWAYVVDIHLRVATSVPGYWLRNIARKPVKQKSLIAIGKLDAIREKLHHQVVRNEITAIHVLLCFFAKCRLRPHRGPQEVAGRNVRHTQAFLNELCLCAFSRTWGT